jgi:K+-sensing histidine kinase KdpD
MSANRQANYNNRDYSLADYCHDIQEMLRNMFGQLHCIKTRLQNNYTHDRELVSLIDLVLKSVLHLENWSRNLLQREHRRPASSTDLARIVNEIEILTGRSISGKRYTVQVDSRIPSLNVNFFELLCVFQNLIENSVKYTNIEPVTIDINFIECSRDFVKILFSDNGGAIPEANKEAIKNAINDRGNKNSLGLSICKRMLTICRGTIEFIEDSRGCTYEISLPIFADGGKNDGKII